ncbi:hypothetical protein SD70_12050 [Gordoniibacillus kamchatkensis]|uniref:Glycosyltransferase n=1 Tax=Gordoniibacillus kamchatkensis TaxID=1590651 RepID=A0ABR5AJC6_9BACL|nr:hypothetical protein [Paenibacillus sp. VKM B-2647]KIL40645.1 hypothetical protein SD70_12050 [Paenibacillus sp. VKM B-2647]
MLGLFAIMACYLMAVVLVHAYGRLMIGRKNGRKPAHVVLITNNNESQIEWYVRSLYFFSKFRGRQIDTTVLDEGSTDDTLRIVEKLSRKHPMHIGLHGEEAVDEFLKRHEQDDVIVVRLHRQEDVTKWLQLQQ